MLEPYEAPATALRLVFTAIGLIDTFTPEQRNAALLSDFGDPRRVDWDMIPKPDRTGVSLHMLDRHQKVLTWDLIRMCLPQRTFTKVLAITQLEAVLRDYEHALLGPALQAWRTPDSYFLTIFGRPGFEDTWALRFLGHHVSLNVTVIQERWIVATPVALGAQPTEYEGVLKPLEEDEGLGFALLEALDDDQKSQAVIHDVSPADFVTRQVSRIGAVELGDNYDLGMLQYKITDADREATRFDRSKPRGICGAALTYPQQQQLWELIDCFLTRLPDEAIEAQQWRLRKAGIDHVHFAWAGATCRGASHYFRVQTDCFLIEAVNAVNGGNHLHTVLRDLDNDFGYELLTDPTRDPSLPNPHLLSRTASTVDLER